MHSWKRVLFLLIINILLIAFTLYFFDYMRIIDYRRILAGIQGNSGLTAAAKLEDPLLLEKEELAKKWEALTIKENEISNIQLSVDSNRMALEEDLNQLAEQREAFLNDQALAEIKEAERNTYDLKIVDVATQIGGMPPQTAAELLNLQDDLQVVDIFKKMDELAAQNGQASTVPFLLTLLEREKAARVQSLMLVNETP
ncbi:MAG: periplasmic-type flagellar collar protein FlbB [Brevinema sp.]